MTVRSVSASFAGVVGLLVLPGCGGGNRVPPPPRPPLTAAASNHSTTTQCAEEDNVCVALKGSVKSFVIEATHPTYEVGQDNSAPDFSNCPDDTGPTYQFHAGVFKLFDDGQTLVEAVRDDMWWRPRGMDARVDNGTVYHDIHYVRVYRKIAGANEWPQFCVLYMDGNLRLIPHPPEGRTSVCFGSSVVIGPSENVARPIAEIARVRYASGSNSIEVEYLAGGSATLDLSDVSRTEARVTVTVNYPTDKACATFRSMFVEDGNADVDHVEWTDAEGASHDDKILDFGGGQASEWLFHRKARSRHNTSAPDIRIELLR